jgi:hypothetical protein
MVKMSTSRQRKCQYLKAAEKKVGPPPYLQEIERESYIVGSLRNADITKLVVNWNEWTVSNSFKYLFPPPKKIIK